MYGLGKENQTKNNKIIFIVGRYKKKNKKPHTNEQLNFESVEFMNNKKCLVAYQ